MKRYKINGKWKKIMDEYIAPWERGGLWDIVPVLLLSILAYIVKVWM